MDEYTQLNVLEHVRLRPISIRVLAARMAGYALLVGGTCAYALLIAALAVGLVTFDTDDHYRPAWTPPAVQPATNAEMLLVVLVIVGFFVHIPVGMGLLRYGRRGVLYLRRFGYTPRTSALTQAISSLGGRWRFVTLDDRGAMAPQGPHRRARSRASLVKRLDDGQDLWLDRLEGFAAHIKRWLRPAQVSFGILMALTLGSGMFRPGLYPTLMTISLVVIGVVAILIVLVFVPKVLAVFLRIVLLRASVAAGGIGGALEEADHSKFTEISSAEELSEKVRRVKRNNRRVLAPQLAVLRTDDAIWREVVLGLAGVCRIALFDVSEPRAGIVWEIDQLSQLRRITCVFVGEHGRLTDINKRLVGENDVVDKLVGLVAGRPVLAYHDQDADFVRQLRSVLESSDRT